MKEGQTNPHVGEWLWIISVCDVRFDKQAHHQARHVILDFEDGCETY